MIDPTAFGLFLLAAGLIAVSPGPGLFFVASRALSGGFAEGAASTLGTTIGGFAHVIAGAVGVSALVMASAELFTLLKFAGALYLVWLGVKAFRQAGKSALHPGQPRGVRRAFVDGILVEALNPKTAAFFLAFIPQFIDPEVGSVAVQFVLFGAISVALNSMADVGVSWLAASLRGGFAVSPHIQRRLGRASGLVLCGFGLSLALVRRPT